jgi:hypothetical protein
VAGFDACFEPAGPNLQVTAVNQQLLEYGGLVSDIPAANLLRFSMALVISKADITNLLDQLDGTRAPSWGHWLCPSIT